MLLGKFRWGHSFFEVNRELLDGYAACHTSTEVVAWQQEYLEKIQKEDADERLRGMF